MCYIKQGLSPVELDDKDECRQGYDGHKVSNDFAVIDPGHLLLNPWRFNLLINDGKGP